MINLIRRHPSLGRFLQKISKKFHFTHFLSSEIYWIQRYDSGGNSGPGSYNKLAKFKSEVINDFVQEHNITSIIEFGCGDGNQIKLTDYPSYLGFDVSPRAIELCRERFNTDNSKYFKLMNEYDQEKAQLTLSLDVIYHLIEDEIFNSYMNILFKSSEKYVIIYSSNTDQNPKNQGYHIKHREFSKWINTNLKYWHQYRFISNKYPLIDNIEEGSLADFYIYRKIDKT